MAGKSPAPVMADVARLAGCDTSTVSLALRRDPRIRRETRERIERVAAEIGYRVHPMVSAWVARRRARRPSQQAVPLAYVTTHPAGVAWGTDSHFDTIFRGARDRVQEFGYRLTEWRLAEYEDRLGALDRVFHTRAVQGIIWGPTLRPYRIEGVTWDRFSVVTIGYALQAPVLHRVTEDHYFGMKLAFENCLLRHHRRIGLAITGQHHGLRRERWIGAYLAEQQLHLRPRERLGLLQPPGENSVVTATEARDWLARTKPDIVLADQPRFWSQFDVPALGFAIAGPEPTHGVHENNGGIGRHAADLLIGLLQCNERGLPSSRKTVLVEPEYRE